MGDTDGNSSAASVGLSDIKVPLAIAGSFVVMGISGLLWLQAAMADSDEKNASNVLESEQRVTELIREQNAEIESIDDLAHANEIRVERLQAESDTAWKDRYTRTMAERDALRRVLANPGMLEPDPANPGEYLKVGGGKEDGFTDD